MYHTTDVQMRATDGIRTRMTTLEASASTIELQSRAWSRFSVFTLVFTAKCICLCMTVWTDDTKIHSCAIVSITINVIELKWNWLALPSFILANPAVPSTFSDETEFPAWISFEIFKTKWT